MNSLEHVLTLLHKQLKVASINMKGWKFAQLIEKKEGLEVGSINRIRILSSPLWTGEYPVYDLDLSTKIQGLRIRHLIS
jgi:hypothetical protein